MAARQAHPIDGAGRVSGKRQEAVSPASADGQKAPRVRPTRERLTAHQYAKDALRHAILSGSLPGGTRLVQAELAAELGVSTTPIREALRDLVADGLIIFDPHRGALVRSLSVAEVQEVYAIRRVLEPLAVRMATDRITKDELAEAAWLLEQLEKCSDPAEWVQLNWRFHSLLESAARSPRLESMVKSVQDIATLYVAHSVKQFPQRLQEGNREHRALLSAVRQKDPDRASEILVEHLDGTLKAVLVGWPQRASGA
jgi:DNA-binding GntR family transcriptional regulator